MGINPEAQRSLAKGADKQTTAELLDDDRAHTTPRMKEFVSFCEHLIRLSDINVCGEGFLGAVQVVVPESYRDARVVFPVDEDHDVDRGVRIGEFVAKPGHGEAALNLSDGQGRLVGFHSLAKTAKERVVELEKKIRKAQKAGEDATEIQEQLEGAKGFREKVNRFLSNNHITVVCYVADIAPDGKVVGLDTNAEKRLFIEGNHLNSMATKEEVMKYEAYSPVIRELMKLRVDVRFMAPDYIEEDSKSIGLKSAKVFTLSALAKSYSMSIINDEDPIKQSTHDDFRPVPERTEFVRAYWEKIQSIFGTRWTVPDLPVTERVKYLMDKRTKKIACFSAIFLDALGQVGFTLGQHCGWKADSPDMEMLDRLKVLDYDPASNRKWRGLMMKESAKQEENGQPEYVFNNARDSFKKVRDYLMTELGVGEATTRVPVA